MGQECRSWYYYGSQHMIGWLVWKYFLDYIWGRNNITLLHVWLRFFNNPIVTLNKNGMRSKCGSSGAFTSDISSPAVSRLVYQATTSSFIDWLYALLIELFIFYLLWLFQFPPNIILIFELVHCIILIVLPKIHNLNCPMIIFPLFIAPILKNRVINYF